MTASAVIAALAGVGVRLSVDAGKLRISAPAGIVTLRLREWLGENKPAVLEALAVKGEAPDLRRLLWREGKRLGFPVVGRDGWASFCATGPIEQVADTLLWLNEQAEAVPAADPYEADERAAIADPACN